MDMRAILFCLAALLIGCGEKAIEKPKAKAPGPPKITHFYGNEAVVPKGRSLTLCYGTENVESLTLRPSADGELRPSLNRCVAETVDKETTFTLTAKGPGGETSAAFTVRVGIATPKGRTMIQDFTVVGNTPVAPGGRVQLCYSTENATGVEVRPSVKAELTLGRNQCFAVTPQKTTNYILTARAADGAVDRMQVTVPVQ